MKKFIFITILLLISSCTKKNIVYWCGDHACVNKDEKESYFKKTMIVEVKNDQIVDAEKISNIEKIITQSKSNKVDYKIKNEDLKKNNKSLNKRIIKEKKRQLKEEKRLAKIANKEEKKRLKKEKKLEKRLKSDEKKLKKQKIGKNKKVAKNPDVLPVSSTFSNLVKNILNRDSHKSFPDINNIPE